VRELVRILGAGLEFAPHFDTMALDNQHATLFEKPPNDTIKQEEEPRIERNEPQMNADKRR